MYRLPASSGEPYMRSNATTIERLKSVDIPQLFESPSSIGDYGHELSPSKSITELSNLMESGATGLLAEKISLILSKMAAASPERIAAKPSRLERWLGRSLERHVRYKIAREELEVLLSEAASDARAAQHPSRLLEEMSD